MLLSDGRKHRAAAWFFLPNCIEDRIRSEVENLRRPRRRRRGRSRGRRRKLPRGARNRGGDVGRGQIHRVWLPRCGTQRQPNRNGASASGSHSVRTYGKMIAPHSHHNTADKNDRREERKRERERVGVGRVCVKEVEGCDEEEKTMRSDVRGQSEMSRELRESVVPTDRGEGSPL